MTVAPQGGAYNSAVTLSCSSGNLPPQTTCVFDPPTVTPGASGRDIDADDFDGVDRRGVSRRAGTRLARGAITTLASGIGIFPSTLTFGSQTINTTAPAQLVSLTNTGADALNVTSITPSGDFAVVSNCGTVVAAGRELRRLGDLYADGDRRAHRHAVVRRRRVRQPAPGDADRHRRRRRPRRPAARRRAATR